MDGQRKDLLNTHYFHVVFTVPSELNPLFLHDRKSMFTLLFKAASETVLELCADRKYLGAVPGITAVLHTWGQNLQFHPHVHMIVTGGGLTPEHTWRSSKKKFFLPVRVLSAKFRGKFMAFLGCVHICEHVLVTCLDPYSDFQFFLEITITTSDFKIIKSLHFSI